VSELFDQAKDLLRTHGDAVDELVDRATDTRRDLS
jgi:hypothetical protein